MAKQTKPIRSFYFISPVLQVTNYFTSLTGCTDITMRGMKVETDLGMGVEADLAVKVELDFKVRVDIDEGVGCEVRFVSEKWRTDQLEC